jgi:hypothetical protein
MNIETLRGLREIMFQAAATIMIPLTVAGMGWYYTRWQQNLNDLKTMIDLVSDDNAERRKYGVAMFEYLLKNDKVPVEFVAAQLDYANNSSDQDLLPLMEAALLKASRTNPGVAQVYSEAMGRLPSRIFVHIVSDDQRACMRNLVDALKDGDKATITVPSIVKAAWGGTSTELRVLRDGDLARGGLLRDLFQSVGFPVKLVDLSASWDGAKRVRPNTFEMWFGAGELPPVCATPAPAANDRSSAKAGGAG